MNILGLSFGRKMKNCEILVKRALMGAEHAGAQVRFLRTIDLRVDHCIACGACSAGLRAGKQVRCVLRDDYHIIEQAVLDADAIIVAAPVYVLGPVGQFKNFVDRFGPAHDMATLLSEQQKREREAGEPVDQRCLKRRFVGYISVGGAHTQNWVSFGLPGMHLFGLSNTMCPIGQIDAYDMGQSGGALLRPDLMDQAFALGEAAGDALSGRGVRWMGDEGTCPVCHMNQITLLGGKKVECPVCGIEGELSISGDQVRVCFPPEQQARARYTLAGLEEHCLEIRGMGAIAGPKLTANKAMLDEETKRYASYPNND